LKILHFKTVIYRKFKIINYYKTSFIISSLIRKTAEVTNKITYFEKTDENLYDFFDQFETSVAFLHRLNGGVVFSH